MKQKGSYIANEIVNDYKREQRMKAKIEAQKRREEKKK